MALPRLILLTLLALPSAVAAPIATLFNTDVTNSRFVVRFAPSFRDPHYSVVESDLFTTGVAAAEYFNDAYSPDDTTSGWISKNANGGAIFNEQTRTFSDYLGPVTFRTTFSLTGFNPEATHITVHCAADNGEDNLVRLNGVVLAGQCDDYDAFGVSSFDIESGFLPELNTLDFTIINSGGPYAFRAAFDSETQPTAVPEPGSFAILLLGLVPVLIGYRVRSKSSTAGTTAKPF